MDSEEVRNSSGNEELSVSQKERIKNNKLKALALRKSRIRHNPYHRKDSSGNREPTKTDIVEDSKGGFILPPKDDRDTSCVITQDDPPALGDECTPCKECNKKFAESFLLSNFKLSVCNECKDPEDKHSLITKTEAKEKYLLKECDFQDRGGPPLEFLLKKNPRGYHGDMKLFLLCQVKERAHVVWDGEEGIEKEKNRRSQAKEKRKEKNYEKQLKDLRSQVYSRSIATTSSHRHDYGSEIYNPSTDNWTKSCTLCEYTVTFEKM